MRGAKAVGGKEKALELARLLGVGIDVSKETLAVALVYEGKTEEYSYTNDEAGIEQLRAKLQGNRGSYKIVMESTARYHFLIALRLSEAGLDVRVINPLLAKRYTKSQIRKVKTDKADARVLAQVAILEEKLPKPFSTDKKAVQIRQKMGLLASLEKQLQALKAILGDYQSFQVGLGIEGSAAEQEIGALLKSLAKQTKRLEQEINELVLSQAGHTHSCGLLHSIPGIATPLAALMAQFLDPKSKHPKQWIAFLGMDVSVSESGKWTGKGKLTKRGNPYLRKRFYNAAWGAVINYPDFRAYYDQLKQQARTHVEALNIIARKLLRIAFVVIRDQIPYDPTLAFPSSAHSAPAPS